MTPTLEELPLALLETHVCAFLDAASLARLELGASRELREAIRASSLWAALVARRFGLEDRPRLARAGWKRVFAAAQQDARALADAAHDRDAARVCADRRAARALALGPRELGVRDELALMQALRRFPASGALVALYARLLRESPRPGSRREGPALLGASSGVRAGGAQL